MYQWKQKKPNGKKIVVMRIHIYEPNVIRMKYVKINYACILFQYVNQSKILFIIKKYIG